MAAVNLRLKEVNEWGEQIIKQTTEANQKLTEIHTQFWAEEKDKCEKAISALQTQVDTLREESKKKGGLQESQIDQRILDVAIKKLEQIRKLLNDQIATIGAYTPKPAYTPMDWAKLLKAVEATIPAVATPANPPPPPAPSSASSLSSAKGLAASTPPQPASSAAGGGRAATASS